eukprot:sb/3464510/
MFLQRALEKILADKEIKKSYNSEIKQECEEKLKQIKAVIIPDGAGTEHLPASGDINADHYFRPFQMACRSRSPKIVSNAIDCLQKLMAYGQLTGQSMDPDNPQRKLIDAVIETVCEAFHGVNTDPDVELQIIKALLTAVTNVNCEVHEMTLLTAIRCCYNINLFTKSNVNSATAKATLTQMLSVCFTQMEQHSEHLVKKPEVVKITTSSAEPPSSDNGEEGEKGRGEEGEKGRGEEVAHGTEDEAPLEQPEKDDIDIYSFSLGLVQNVIDAAIVEVEGPHPISADDSMFNVTQPCDDTQTESSETAHTEGREEEEDEEKREEEPVKVEEPKRKGVKFDSIYMRDAYLVLRTLCKMTMQPLPEGPLDPRSHEMRSKMLALQLLLSVMQSAGPVLRTHKTFAQLIKQFLRHNCLFLLVVQSDPDLVTSSGERVLVTKSGWPLNRGQIPLISCIGGNLSCH